MARLEEAIARALAQGEALAQRALSAHYDVESKRLILRLEGDVERSIPRAYLPISDEAALAEVRVEGGGFDFPAADEGLYVPDLCRAAIEHRLAA